MVREKQTHYLQSSDGKTLTRLPAETVEATRQWNASFKGPKWNNDQSVNLYTLKLALRNEVNIKTFQTNKNREAVTVPPALKGLLKKLIQTKERWSLMKIQKSKKQRRIREKVKIWGKYKLILTLQNNNITLTYNGI